MKDATTGQHWLQSPFQTNHSFDSVRVSSLRPDWAGFIWGPKICVPLPQFNQFLSKTDKITVSHTATSSHQFFNRLQHALQMLLADGRTHLTVAHIAPNVSIPNSYINPKP